MWKCGSSFNRNIFGKNRVIEFIGTKYDAYFLLHYYLVRGLATKVVPSWFGTFIGQLAITIVSIGSILIWTYAIGRCGAR